MQDPKALQGLIQMLSGADPPALKQLETRARRGQFTFAATQYATRSNCACDACHFLRTAVDEELADARKEAGLDASRDDPLPRPAASLSPAQPAPDASGGDLPG